MRLSGPPQPPLAAKPTSRWRLLLGGLLSLLSLWLVIANRTWLTEAVGLARIADPQWLLLALALEGLSFFVISQAFRVVLHSLGYQVGAIRLWAMALVTIILSQSVPAGGVAGFAFLMTAFKRRKVPSTDAALIATLEAVGYAAAMIIILLVGIVFIVSRSFATGVGDVSFVVPLVAGAVAISVLGSVVFVLTRSEASLARGLLWLSHSFARLLRRVPTDGWATKTVTDLVRGRTMIMGRRRVVAQLIMIELVALSGHALALLAVLGSLGSLTSFPVVLSAYGIALITSTFNVLPGGGGTVETVLVTVLSQLGVGATAVPATIIFRLLNFWALMPLAGICYIWLMRAPQAARTPLAKDLEA